MDSWFSNVKHPATHMRMKDNRTRAGRKVNAHVLRLVHARAKGMQYCWTIWVQLKLATLYAMHWHAIPILHLCDSNNNQVLMCDNTDLLQNVGTQRQQLRIKNKIIRLDFYWLWSIQIHYTHMQTWKFFYQHTKCVLLGKHDIHHSWLPNYSDGKSNTPVVCTKKNENYKYIQTVM